MSKQSQCTYKEKLEIVQEIFKCGAYSSVGNEYDVLRGTIANWKKKHIEGALHRS